MVQNTTLLTVLNKSFIAPKNSPKAATYKTYSFFVKDNVETIASLRVEGGGGLHVV